MSTSSNSVKFGTSGLRGLAADMTDEVCARHVGAFLTHLDALGMRREAICLGMDKRRSSPRIAGACAAAAKRHGLSVVWAGILPTPALALYAIGRDLPAIMITGSHNPEDQNGLKFYRADGELLKKDEEPLLDLVGKQDLPEIFPVGLPSPDPQPHADYLNRYRQVFGPDCLAGLRLGADLHSAAGGNIIVPLLESLGATCVTTRKSDTFLAVDTEAIDAAYLSLARDWIGEHELDAVVSTDGDGDRPLVIDETGIQIDGEILGALTSRHLGFDHVVTPVSSLSTVETTSWFKQVERTRIGSPYVIEAMSAICKTGVAVAGFEANGGFLTMGRQIYNGKPLPPLPTRDAMLPIIAVLAAARRHSLTLSGLIGQLPSRVKASGRLQDYPTEASLRLMERLAGDLSFRSAFYAPLAQAPTPDRTDGVRFVMEDGDVMHFRPSGNAAELRCYVETADRARSAALLDDGLRAAARWLEPAKP